MALQDDDISIKVGIDTAESEKDVLKFIDGVKLKLAQLKAQPQVDASQLKALEPLLASLTGKIGQLSKSTDININTKQLAQAQSAVNSIASQIDKLKNPTSLNIVADRANRELETINKKLETIKNITATGLVLKFSEIGLGAILNSLGSLKDLSVNAFQSGLNIASQYETIQVGLNNTLKNTARSQLEANTAFSQGKGTIEDLATATGRSVDSFYKQEKASGGVKGATKELKSELNGLKDSKRDLQDQADKEIKANNSIIKSTNDIIKSIEKERDARLQNANATDKELEAEDRKIKAQERVLNKEVSDATRTFERDNAGKILDNRKQQLNLEKQISDVTDQQKANKGNTSLLVSLSAQKDALQEQLETLKEQKSQIDLNKESLLTEIELRQNNTRQQLADQKDILQAKKDTNAEIKSDFEIQIASQKTIIDNLKNQIEERKIKLDADISPIEEKLKTVQDKVDAISLSSGGGGGGKATSVLTKDARDLLSSKNKNTQLDPKFANKTEDEIDAILTGEAVKRGEDLKTAIKNYAVTSPFTRLSATNLASALTSFGVDPLAGVGDINDKNGIKNAGSKNILNSASDLIAYDVTRNPGVTSDQASNDFIRAISELQGGQTKSLQTRFNISSSQLDNSARKAGLASKLVADGTGFKNESYSNLQGGDLTALINELVKTKNATGLAGELTQTYGGKVSNLEDQAGNLAESFFGDPKNKSSLISQIEKAVTTLTDELGDPAVQKALSEFGQRIGQLLEEAVTPDNIKKLAQSIEGFFNFVSQALSPSNIIKISGAIEDLALFASDPQKFLTGGFNTEERASKKYFQQRQIQDTFSFESNGKTVDPTKFLDKSQGSKLAELQSQRDVNNKFLNNEDLSLSDRARVSSTDVFGGVDGKDLIKKNTEIQAEINALLEESNAKFKAQQQATREEFTKTAEAYKTTFASASTDVQDKISLAFTGATQSASNFNATSDEKLQTFVSNLKTSFGTIPPEIQKVLDDTNTSSEEKLKTFEGNFSKSFTTINESGSKSFKELTSKSLPELEALRAKIAGSQDKDKKAEIDTIDGAISLVKSKTEQTTLAMQDLGKKGSDSFKLLLTDIEKIVTKLGGENLIKGTKDGLKAIQENAGKVKNVPILGDLAQGVGALAGAKASGGAVLAGGNYLVGEKGPEIVNFNKNGFITPNDVMRDVMNSVQNTVYNQQKQVTYSPTFNYNINATGSSNIDSAYTANMNGSQYDSILKYGF